MKITITFHDDNAAFEDNGAIEYKDIMSQVYERIWNQEKGTFTLRDSNGNKVGTVKIRPTEE